MALIIHVFIYSWYSWSYSQEILVTVEAAYTLQVDSHSSITEVSKPYKTKGQFIVLQLLVGLDCGQWGLKTSGARHQ